MASPNDGILSQAPSAGETVGAFFGWWGARLAECVPAPLRAWLAGREQSVVLDWEADGLSLRRVGSAGAVSQPLARAPLDIGPQPKADDFSSALKTLASRVRGPVTLAIGESRVLRKTLKMPLATRENLRVAVGYDIDRLTPFSADSVLFDTKERSVDHAARQVHADFVATPRAPVDALVVAAQRAGVNITRVVPSAQDASGELNLIRRPEAETRHAFWQSPHFWLSLLSLTLLSAVLAFPLWQKREQVIAGQPKLIQAERDAIEADKLNRELQQRISQYNFLPAKRHSTPLSIQIVDEVTKLLPDDTWVQSLELKSIRTQTPGANGSTTAVVTRELQIQGESESSSKLIPTFEKSPLVATPQFKSPLTKLNYPGQNVNGDRFHVAMEVKVAPLPPVVPIATQVAAPPVVPTAQNQPTISNLGSAPAGTAPAKAAEKASEKPAVSAVAPQPSPPQPVSIPMSVPMPTPMPEGKK